MAMEWIPDDYVPPQPEKQTWANGEYKVKGMLWSLPEGQQNPVLVAQKKTDRLVGYLRFKLEDGKDGPPMSLELGEMALFAKALGADVKTLPPLPTLDRPGDICRYMQAVEKGVNDAAKSVTVEVRNGWVNTVPGMDVSGFMYFIPIDFITRDETTDEPTYREGQWGPFFTLRYEVIGGEGGAPNMYTGAKFIESMSYAIVVMESENGEIGIDWEKSPKDGTWTASAVANAKLMKLTAPDLFASDGVFDNPHNLLPQWWEMCRARKQVLKGTRSRNSKGNLRIDWSSVEAAIGAQAPVTMSMPKPVPKPVEDVDIDDQARKLLRRLMTMMTSPADAFEGNTYNLTLAGKEIARTYLRSLKEQGLISVGFIGEMTYGDVAASLEKADWPLNVKDNVEVLKKELLGIGVVSDADADF